MKLPSFARWLEDNKVNIPTVIYREHFPVYFHHVKSLIQNNKIQRLSFPIEVLIEMTSTCDLKCVYCYKGEIQGNQFLPFAAITRLVESATKSHYLFLAVLEGGEPLLHPQFLEIFKTLKGSSIPVDIITNGVNFSPLLVREIRSVFVPEQDDIQISLDGIGVYNFLNRGIDEQKVIDGIRLLNENGIIPRVHCVVTCNNCEGLVELIKYLNTNCRISLFSMNTPFGKSFSHLIPDDDQAIRIYADIAAIRRDLHFELSGFPFRIEVDCQKDKKSGQGFRRCTAALSKLCIAPDGSVYPCVFLENKMQPLGNILKEDILSVWGNSESTKFANHVVLKSKECIQCTNAKFCHQNCVGEQI